MKIKALDIIDGDSNILERFKDMTPGTEKHCRNVSMLCESVGKNLDNINIDNLVAASLIHDIGKCCNPQYFSENQDTDKNIHDELDPSISYQYISRHISDGVLKLTQLGVDCDVIRIVSEHHGDTIIGSIYNKAKDKSNKISDIHYRYKSCKPSCVESCVLMICDVVESVCRSISNSGKIGDTKNVINNLINNLVDDEQLDVLTIGEIRIIKMVLLKEIESMYHKRVSYDDGDKDDAAV